MDPSAQRDTCNVLVCSDLHLTLVMGQEDRATDEEFAAFLAHYQQHRQGDRPWRLVLAGDTFDFVYPDMRLFIERQPDGAPASQADGFLQHWDVDAIAWRLGVTLDQRPELALGLVRFLLAGNHVSLIKGNHDVELQWAVVQRALVQALARAAAQAGLTADAEALRQQVTFHAWFYLEPGALYVEHGSQYDEFNCTPNFLDPALVQDSRRAFMPLGSRLTHYLTNAFPEYKPRPTPGAFQRYIKESGQQFSRKYVGRSLRVISHALANAGLFSEEGWRTGTGKEDHRLVQQSRRSGVEVETLARLQGLQAKPATAIRGFFFNRMLLDRLFVVAFALAALAVALLCGAMSLGEPALAAAAVAAPALGLLGALKSFKYRHWRLPLAWLSPAVMVGACVATSVLIDGATLRGAALVTSAGFVVCLGVAILPLTEARDLRTHLQEVAAAARRVVGVPLVIFGHHHLPNEAALPDGGQYINSGAWVNSGVDCDHAHVVLLRRDDGTLDASLRRGRDFWGGQP